jgi:hypothetical protein
MLRQSFSIFLIAASVFLALPSQARAQKWTGDCIGTNASGVDADTDVATLKGAQCIIANVISAAIRLIGITLLVMLVVGGLKILSSGGDPKALEAGKQTITSAIIGLLIAVFSWFFLQIIEEFTGVSVTTFSFPF